MIDVENQYITLEKENGNIAQGWNFDRFVAVSAPETKLNDPINSPSHYTSSPSGMEFIVVAEHMNFCIGNAVKYLWRAGLKGEGTNIEDLKKARWYIDREIARLEKVK